MISGIGEYKAKEINPANGFRYFAASEWHNLPAMYCADDSVTVVAHNIERHFPLTMFAAAVECYRDACRKNGKDVPK